MEPITHFLTGACIGRAGFNRKTACATLVAVLAAEAPDLDVFWGFAGPVEGLKHHRGITHTLIGAPVVAAVVVIVVGLGRRWRDSSRARRASLTGAANSPDPSEPSLAAPPSSIRQPIHWGWLYLTALVSSLSHLLLDWTNNYGLRPFFPFNPRWYAGSFMFIAEPIFWVVFFLALTIPGLLGLADREIGARKVRFRGRGWAIFALCCMVALWCWRWAEHAKGMALVENNQVADAPVTRFALEPYAFNPFRWHAILETANYYQTAEVNTLSGEVDTDPRGDVIHKPADTPAVEAAKQTLLGQVYLDWGTWAVVQDVGQEPIAVQGLDPPRLPAGRIWTTVEFTDLRFNYSFANSGRASGRSALGGWVYIVDGREEAGQVMNGRVQK